MHVQSIRVRDIENRWESLSLAIQAISRWAGVELHFRSVNAALGLSFMISAPKKEGVDLAWWMMYGREAFLKETGALFGLKIETLHDSAFESGSQESFEEFESTVKAKLTEAIANNQPVLAWQGWPDYHSHLWGVITEQTSSELGFDGTTMWAHGKSVPLAAPPKRLFLVEEIEPRQPSADELLVFSVANIRKVVHNQLDASLNVDTGLAAYDRWLDWLRRTPTTPAEHDHGPNNHYQMARFVTHNRESACRFIDHYKDGLHDDIRNYLEAMHADCRGTINAFATSRDLKAVSVLYRSEDGRQALSAGVHACRDFLQAQAKTIDHLAEALGI